MAMIEKSPNSEIHDLARERGANGTSEARARLHEVVIAGVPLRLKSSHDAQTVNDLVALVDQRIKEALPLTKTGSIQNASILASLHLAEENLLLRSKAKAEIDRLESKTLKVISELESSRMTGLQGKEERTSRTARLNSAAESFEISESFDSQEPGAIDRSTL
jgi:cell division protein ZapA